jgi:RNA polymerase sigma-70 factor, ECF subfamily
MMPKLLPFPSRHRSMTSVEELSDANVVALCAAGDAAAMGWLFDRWGGAVWRFLARLCPGHTGDIEDLVQTTFVEALRVAKHFRGKSQVKTWLFGIAFNISRHHRRGEARRHAFLTAWTERPLSGGGRPDQMAEERQLLTLIGRALAVLPHDLRAAFVLCDLEGLEGKEAASALMVRTGTLRRRLHEARKALRAAVEEGAA